MLNTFQLNGHAIGFLSHQKTKKLTPYNSFSVILRLKWNDPTKTIFETESMQIQEWMPGVDPKVFLGGVHNLGIVQLTAEY